ncbi:MAG: hypothetical protein ACE5E5_13490 [Phycisphaerae bacterium]
MAEIPSHLASSAAGSPLQARELAKEREARRSGAADTAQQQIKKVGETDSTVEADDADTAVFSDAEGAGSQGRTEEEVEASPEPPDEPEGGVVTDDDGHLHLDIEA